MKYLLSFLVGGLTAAGKTDQCDVHHSAQGALLRDHLGRQENQQLRFIGCFGRVLEQVTQDRQITQQRNFGRVVDFNQFSNTTDHDRAHG